MRIRSSRFFVVGMAVVCLAIGAIAAPASAKTPKLVPDPNGTFSFGQAATFGMTFNPHTWASGLSYYPAFVLMYDRLIQVSPDSKSLAPMLATSWKWNAADTQLTFTLRQGVKFQDGEPFNALVAVANIEAAAAPGANSQAQLADMTEATATGPYTMQLTFSTPDPGVLFDFVGYTGMEVSPNGLSNPSSLQTQPSGSGPYKLASVTSSLTYNFIRFNGYWNKKHSYPLNFQYQDIANETTRLNAVETGSLDATYITGATYPTAEGNTSIPLLKIPALAIYVLFMNSNIAPLNNLQVRQAISLALDRQAFDASQGGTCPVADQVIPPGVVGYVKGLTMPTNVSEAKQMIQQAGATGATITLVDSPIQPFATFAQLVQNQLDTIGLNIQIDANPNNRTVYGEGGAGMEFATAIMNAPDPTQIVDPYVLGSSNPASKTVDPVLAAEIHSAEALPLGSSARTKAFQAINRALSSNQYLLWVPVCQSVNIFVANKNVIGLNAMPDSALGVAPDDSYLQIAK